MNVKVLRRKVKYPRIELKKGYPVLILPENSEKAEEIIEKHKNWIEKKLRFINDLKVKYKNRKIYKRDEKEFCKLIRKFINEFEKKLQVEVKGIKLRQMKTKWGSCNKKGEITLNTILKFLPPSLIKYVVFHEMVHLVIKKHNKGFWSYIKKEFNNPEKYEEKLLGYWFLIQSKPSLFYEFSKEKGVERFYPPLSLQD